MSTFDDAVRDSKPIEPDPEPTTQHDPLDDFEPAFIPQSCFDKGWHCTNPPEREWVIHNALPALRVGALIGSGGSGKSRFELIMVVAIATGRPFFGFSVDRPGAVMIIAGEDEDNEAHRRLTKIITQLPPEAQELAWRNIIFESRVGINSLITDANSITKQVERTAFLFGLIKSAQMIPNLVAIFLDPLSRVRGGEENASQDTTRFVEAAEYLAGKTGAAVVLLHHASKSSAATGDGASQHAARGSSALVDGCRFVWNLTGLTPNEAKRFNVPEELRKDFAKLSNSKNNYARRFDDMFFDMRGEVRQMVGTNTGTASSSDTAVLAKIKAIIEDKAKLGIRFTRRSFVNNFAGVQKGLGLSKAALDLIIQEAIGRSDLITHHKKGGNGLELYLPGETLTEGAENETF